MLKGLAITPPVIGTGSKLSRIGVEPVSEAVAGEDVSSR